MRVWALHLLTGDQSTSRVRLDLHFTCFVLLEDWVMGILGGDNEHLTLIQEAPLYPSEEWMIIYSLMFLSHLLESAGVCSYRDTCGSAWMDHIKSVCLGLSTSCLRVHTCYHWMCNQSDHVTWNEQSAGREVYAHRGMGAVLFWGLPWSTFSLVPAKHLWFMSDTQHISQNSAVSPPHNCSITSSITSLHPLHSQLRHFTWIFSGALEAK